MRAEPLTEPVAFGDRYQLTRLLAVGGMAEIYLARQPSIHGFEKEIVIKRLKPQLTGDKRVVDMFIDEARIGGLLNHPNIVHVYDIGQEDGIPYIAMEYIRGEELNQLCRRGLELGAFLPLAHALDLIRQAARALGYFHHVRDMAGEQLEVVHCDISPTNLLVTEDGFLKVIDFGIARARDQRYREERAVPGKLSYMSPEQAQRRALDARSDIFSLGVVLYEITLGRRLFKGPAQDVFRRLAAGDIKPPTFVRRDYPGPLESVVMRALELSPSERFETGYELADALEEYMRESGLRSGPVRIARYLDQLTVATGLPRREELISESERLAGEDEGLDFDRGMFEGFRATSDPDPGRALEWDEFEEDEQAIADVIGIDVGLVRAAGKLTEPPPIADMAPVVPLPVPGRVPTPTRTVSAPKPEPESEPESEPDPDPDSGSGSDSGSDSGSGLGAVPIRRDVPPTRRHSLPPRELAELPVIGTPPIPEVWLLIALLVVGGVIGAIITYLLS